MLHVTKSYKIVENSSTIFIWVELVNWK